MFHPANMSNFCLCIAAVIRWSFLKSAAKIFFFHEPTMAFCDYFSGDFLQIYTIRSIQQRKERKKESKSPSPWFQNLRPRDSMATMWENNSKLLLSAKEKHTKESTDKEGLVSRLMEMDREKLEAMLKLMGWAIIKRIIFDEITQLIVVFLKNYVYLCIAKTSGAWVMKIKLVLFCFVERKYLI